MGHLLWRNVFVEMTLKRWLSPRRQVHTQAGNGAFRPTKAAGEAGGPKRFASSRDMMDMADPLDAILDRGGDLADGHPQRFDDHPGRWRRWTPASLDCGASASLPMAGSDLPRKKRSS
jgi:hypothetical protein